MILKKKVSEVNQENKTKQKKQKNFDAKILSIKST